MGMERFYDFDKEKKFFEDLVWNKFFKDKEFQSEKNKNPFTGEYEEFCQRVFGDYVAVDGKMNDSISGQFQSGVSSIAEYQIEVIYNSMAYSFVEKIGICAIQTLWNILENEEINDFQASIILKIFYRTKELIQDNVLLYGDGENIIKIMLKEMKSGNSLDSDNIMEMYYKELNDKIEKDHPELAKG